MADNNICQFFRVTDIVKSTDNKSLRKVLPDIDWDAFKQYETKRFPKYVYTNRCFAHFGFFIDLLVRCVLYQEFRISCDISMSPEQNLFTSIAAGIHWRKLIPDMIKISRIPESPEMPEKINSMALLNKIARDTKELFENIVKDPKEKLVFNEEVSEGVVQGHPDVYYGIGVVEIKCISKPLTNCVQHFSQVSSYAALLREKGLKIDQICIFYTLHKEQKIMLDISEWDHKPLLNLLTKSAEKMKGGFISCNIINENFNSSYQLNKKNKTENAILNSPCNTQCEVEFKFMMYSMVKLPHLGHHVHGVGQLVDSIESFSNIPIQCFLSHNGKFPDYDCEIIKKRLKEKYLLPAFCHLPYFINLCCPKTSKFPNEIESLFLINQEIKVAASMGFSGCVIHVGKNVGKLKYNNEEAWNKMKHYTLWVISNIDDAKCPLLLETPAGQGTEMLTEIMDFIKFYREIIADYPSYYKKVKNKDVEGECPFGICIDTCHVWACGYNPIDYIQTVECELGKDVIKLVHFNDSLEPKGSRKDRHFMACFGYIGATGLLPVYNWCKNYAIPMVTE